MNKRISTFLLLFASLYVVQNVAEPIYAQTNSYDELVTKANNEAKSGDMLLCVATAQSAIQVAPTEFKGYYFAGYCLYEQNLLPQALDYAQKSLEHVPTDQKADVEKLVTLISDEIKFAEQKGVGDEALGQGLRYKAAMAYTAAWRADPAHEDIGVKAAEIWDQLNKPLESAQILNEIVAHPKDPANLSKAQQILTRVQPKLLAEGNQQLQQGQQRFDAGDYAAAEQLLKSAAAVLPGNNADLLLSRLYARNGNLAQVLTELGAGSRKSSLQLLFFANSPEFDAYMRNPQFLSFVSDAIGVAQNDVAKQTVQILRLRFEELVNSSDTYMRFLTGATGCRWYKLDQNIQVDLSQITLEQKAFYIDQPNAGMAPPGNAAWSEICGVTIAIPLNDVDLSTLRLLSIQKPPPNVPPFWVNDFVNSQTPDAVTIEPPYWDIYLESKTKFIKEPTGDCKPITLDKRTFLNFLRARPEENEQRATEGMDLLKRIAQFSQ